MGMELSIVVLFSIWLLLGPANTFQRSLHDTIGGVPVAAQEAPDPSPGAAPDQAPGAAPKKIKAGHDGVFDLETCGAKEGEDITEILLEVWKHACASRTPSKVKVPAGVYHVGEIDFCGPCKAPIEIQVEGTLEAPSDPAHFQDASWIVFKNIDFLTLSGKGAFDGQGRVAWQQNNCDQSNNCTNLPINIRLDFVKHSLIRDVTSQDSKNYNVNILDCENITFDNFNVVTAAGSVDTDGIHVGKSCNINILNSVLRCGDDCVSIGDGTRNVKVTGVTCGQGYGITIGSLGRYEDEEPVTGIYVSNCTITDTKSGLMLKSWPGSNPNTLDDVIFESITMNNVSNAIFLDQQNCPNDDEECTRGIPSSVKMRNVVFRNIKGTGATPEAVQIMCSPGTCTNIELSNVDIQYEGPLEANYRSFCTHVKPIITGVLNPPGPTCL